MELKNAIAVCLISLFSATLVVMIARSLDSQAASRIEPQLAAIVEELQAIRKQGGMSASPGGVSGSDGAARNEAIQSGLIVYYFHSNTRCPTCQAIESQSRETVQADFAAELKRGEMAWKVLNYEQPAGEALAKKFEIQMPMVVLAKMKGGEVQDWKRLSQVWALVGDKPAFAAYIRDQIAGMLGAPKDAGRPAAAATDPPKAAPPPADLPVPN